MALKSAVGGTSGTFTFCTWILAAVLLVGISGCKYSTAKNCKEKMDADVRVRVQPATERVLTEKVMGQGLCEAAPEFYALLTAAAEGRVVGLLKRPGDTLHIGDAVVQLDATVAQNGLAEKQLGLESQRLAVDQADLALKKAKSTLDRLSPLQKRGEVSESNFYEAQLARRLAELQWKAAKAQYGMAEAAVATAKAQLAQLTIRTPVAGGLNGLTCQLGQTLSVGASIGEVVDVSQLQAVIWLPAADARRLKPKQSASIRACGSSLDELSAGSEARGIVLNVGEVADPQTGNLPVRLKIDNALHHLTPKQAVIATIVVREEKSLAVPAAAVRDTGKETALVVVRDGKVVLLHPKLGLKDDGWVAVSGSDLKSEERVIIEGGYNLPDGTEVEVEKDKG